MPNDGGESTPPNSWLWRPLPRPEAALRLVCFPHAAGSPLVFRGWSEALPAEVELCAVRLPGRDNRLGETPYDEWRQLLDALETVLAPTLARPYALFGHSMGAMVAYELARRLAERAARPAVRLLVAGCRGPDVPILVPAIHEMGAAEFKANLGRVAGTPAEVVESPRWLKTFEPLLRADLKLAETWPPAAPSPVGIATTGFAGSDDPIAPPWSMRSWKRYADPFVLRVVAGDHFFPHAARTLLDPLSDELRAALAETA
ncbi:thioesterase II family protein [Salinactinospora qingdaonensis]|uniref:Alpha/beta fold hydrolase n=1 Tax=Salinactinospora qingdaonensis TaxID=702744 RepID=A0ABP7GAQ8_9ACTN